MNRSASAPKTLPVWRAFADRMIVGQSWAWHYESGVVLKALLDAAWWTGRADYLAAVSRAMRTLVREDGRIAGYRRTDYNLDQVNPGRVV